MAENKTIDNIITRLKESGRYNNIFKNRKYRIYRIEHKEIYSSGTMSIMAHRGNKNKGYMIIFQYAENNMKEKRHVLRPLYRHDQIFRNLVDKIHKFLVCPDESDKGYNVLWVKN